ncbi:MAG: nucleotidyltransferase family protein [bacterium]
MERALYAMLLFFVIATVVFILLMRQLRQRDRNRPKRGGMLSDADLKAIRDCAREYGASEIILFGSSLRDHQTTHDIDLGVRGVEPDRFFALYGDLLMKLGKSVDVVDLSQPSKLTAWILKRGQKIYG